MGVSKLHQRGLRPTAMYLLHGSSRQDSQPIQSKLPPHTYISAFSATPRLGSSLFPHRIMQSAASCMLCGPSNLYTHALVQTLRTRCCGDCVLHSQPVDTGPRYQGHAQVAHSTHHGQLLTLTVVAPAQACPLPPFSVAPARFVKCSCLVKKDRLLRIAVIKTA